MMRAPKPLIAALLLSAALSLGACTTTSAGSQQSKVSAALADAAREASKTGRLDEALKLHERLYKSAPDNTDNIIAYAHNLRLLGRVDDARLVIQTPARDAKASAPLLTECAYVMVAGAEYSLAQEYATRAIDKDDDLPDAHQALALALSGLGLHKKAEQEFQTALDAWPKSRDRTAIINNLAMAQAAQGKVEDARITMALATGRALDNRTFMNNRAMLDEITPIPPAPAPIAAPLQEVEQVIIQENLPAPVPAATPKLDLPDTLKAPAPDHKPYIRMQPIIE